MHMSYLIRTRREALNISQGKLANLLGLKTGQIISNIERGECSFPKKRLKRLAKVLLLDRREILDSIVRDEREKIAKLLGVK